MKCVVVDTSFLVNCVRGRADFRKELADFRIVVVSPVLRELRNLNKPESRVALKLLKDYELVEEKGHADKAILRVAEERGCLLATTDKEVRDEARKKDIPLVTLRKGKRIEF